MLISYLKKIALFGIISILFTGHVNSKPLTNSNDNYADYINALCPDDQIAVLRDINNPSSFIKCIPETDYDKSLLPEWARKSKILSIGEDSYNKILERRFKKARIKSQIIQCVVIGFIIITIMSLLINILWRFRLKIPAFLFAILTVLSVIFFPFIFDW
ncbi:hypothetical protein MNL08_04020 [Bartonella krasnovii]|uniref:hypothetical protein n=1 Tax=Bartonella krasnovii TaxID=2267275 RepID=UPI001F4C73BA|nr:hypothetical protein [Bartonella krasnovii]UNF42998.1 hypothetical protein MNL08_04020 [Bartonella krasnovii]UNF47707.1 hypothetical protein MNL05_03310 [Bartonella krasnovii]UNF49318.1 hypothetical protein MNL04_03155 [Bartonella krasnovii]UNF52693.1 hypothetical protein MNL02_03260 [Bartonella krasnovii]UNF56208.1 hypothetical protein MNL00_04030 [Bartonella krasnovii]